LTAWTHNLGEEFETRAVMHAALVLAPLVAVATASGQPIWLEAAIVSGSAFIVMQKTNLAPLGVALHGVAIAVGFLVLLAAISTPPGVRRRDRGDGGRVAPRATSLDLSAISPLSPRFIWLAKRPRGLRAPLY
jgi:hypothetical protein